MSAAKPLPAKPLREAARPERAVTRRTLLVTRLAESSRMPLRPVISWNAPSPGLAAPMPAHYWLSGLLYNLGIST